MHDKSVFVAAKNFKHKISQSRSAKSCLWDVNMLSEFACLIFSTFFNKCSQPYTDRSESAVKFMSGRKSGRLDICDFSKI